MREDGKGILAAIAVGSGLDARGSFDVYVSVPISVRVFVVPYTIMHGRFSLVYISGPLQVQIYGNKPVAGKLQYSGVQSLKS